jgi:hypothetical protein
VLLGGDHVARHARGDARCGKGYARYTRGFEEPLCFQRQPLELQRQHLPDALWHPHHVRIRRGAEDPAAPLLDDAVLRQELLDHVYHEERVAIRVLVNDPRQRVRLMRPWQAPPQVRDHCRFTQER